MRDKKDLYFWKILMGFLTALVFFFGIIFYRGGSDLDNRGALRVKVEEVIDGDTIRVKDLESGKSFRVRYLGIDTPELEGMSYESCFGEQARDKNEELVLDQELILEFDQDRYDRFGRTLAYVYVSDDLGEKDLFVNLKLLEEGFARFYLDELNTLWEDEFIEAVLEAQQGFSGLWGSCGEDEFDKECLIKGNVNRLGEKHYHLPGDKYYSQTIINLDKEDQWLCTIEEAEAKNFDRALE